MYIFFDTETTGLPQNYNAPLSDLNNWPRMVQLAWVSYNENFELTDEKMFIIQPEGYEIPVDVSKIHGITTERAKKEGLDLEFVLNEFRTAMSKAKYLVAHNITFDEKIVGAEFLRKQIKSLPNKLSRFDTMVIGTDVCKIPGKKGYKWPNLNELHKTLFHKEFDGAHDALVDVKACANCFWEMKRLGFIRIN
jgi:DNA polymerase III subunit epsilon